MSTERINTVYPKDTQLLCQPPSASDIEMMHELTAMVGSYLPELRLYGIHKQANQLTMVWAERPSEGQRARIHALAVTLGSRAHVDHVLPFWKEAQPVMSLYKQQGSAQDLVKFDPRT